MPLLVVSCGILLDYRGGEGEGRRGKMKVEKVRQEERQRRGATHHTLPLPRNLVPRIAKTPWVVIDRLLCIHEHVILARAAGMEVCDLADDFWALGRGGEGGGEVGLVFHAGRGVVRGVGGRSQGGGVGAGLVLALRNGGAHGGDGWVRGYWCGSGGADQVGGMYEGDIMESRVSIVERIMASL